MPSSSLASNTFRGKELALTAKRRRQWPPWWNWELKVIDHVYKRMGRREFTEIELRRTMKHALGYRRDHIEGRWVIETRYRRQRWAVIVEPIPEKEQLEVVTAYQAG